MRRTYFISIDTNAYWGTQDDQIAAKQARETAQEYGGCEMITINETGGGHITVYDAQGKIKGYKPLKEVDI